MVAASVYVKVRILITEPFVVSAIETPEFRGRRHHREHWILDTTLYGLGAVRRFYLGLADQIEILDSEDSEVLKAEILAFTRDSIIGSGEDGE